MAREEHDAPRGGDLMPALWRPVTMRMWDDRSFRALSKAPPNGQTLWLRLLTGPESHPIPGLVIAREGGLADALGWGVKGFREAFREVSREGLAQADWPAGVIWLPNAIKHRPPQSPNVVRSWGTYVDDLPDSDLIPECFRGIATHMEGMGEAFREALPEAFREALPKGYPKPSPKRERERERDKGSTTRSLVTTPKGGGTRSKPPPTPEAIEIAQRLYDAIRSHKPDFCDGMKPAKLEAKLTGWAQDIDVGLRNDGMTPAGCAAVIAYAHCSDDHFWRSNLLSGKKLRKHYQTLSIKAQKARAPTSNAPPGFYERLMGGGS